MYRQTILGIFIAVFFITPLAASSISVSTNLSFGTLVLVNTSGSVIYSTGGFTTNGVTIAPSGTGYYLGQVKFTPTLLDVFTFRTTEDKAILTNNRSGGGTVTIDNFSVNPNTLNITLLAPVSITIGGRMRFTSSSKGGTYTGSIRVEASGLVGGTVGVNLPIMLTLWNTLTVSEITPMSFGGLEVSNGASVVRLNPQNAQRTVTSGTGNVTLGTNPAATAARFDVSGEPSTNYTITLPTSITLTGSKGSNINVNNFTKYPSASTVTLDVSGNSTFYVGADLNIGTSQASGTYTGTYTVTVNY